MLIHQRLQPGGVMGAALEFRSVLGKPFAEALGAADVKAAVEAGADGVDAGLGGGGVRV
jgi:hypothetical protein